ncbi:MAG: cytochrome c oxidase assembly factor Coa1 family protein [Candidatus Tumulicola sp.]
MEPPAGPTGINPRVIWIVAIAVLIVILAFVASIVAFALAMLGVMDRSDAHVCGIAAVRSSPAVTALLGSPIEQQGFTGGSSSSENGELSQRVTFTVKGPRGSAFVVAAGHRSPLASHLDVVIGRDQRSQTIYSGPFDCAGLHPRKP